MILLAGIYYPEGYKISSLGSTCTRVPAPVSALLPFLLSQEDTGVQAGASTNFLLHLPTSRNKPSLYRENYSSVRSLPQPGKNCACPSCLGPAPTRSALTSQAEAGWITLKQQMPDCAATSIINYLYQIIHVSVKGNPLIIHW